MFIKKLASIIQIIDNDTKTKVLNEALKRYRELQGVAYEMELLSNKLYTQQKVQENNVKAPKFKKLKELQDNMKFTLLLEKDQLGQLDLMKDYLKNIQTKKLDPPAGDIETYIQNKFPYIVNVTYMLLSGKDNKAAIESLENKKKSLLPKVIAQYTEGC